MNAWTSALTQRVRTVGIVRTEKVRLVTGRKALQHWAGGLGLVRRGDKARAHSHAYMNLHQEEKHNHGSSSKPT